MDVLLVGGGMLDVGAPERSSPFSQAQALRALFPSRWQPGCHAEARLLSLRPELGATVGQVELRRARQLLAAVDELGWQAAPLHLGVREIPAEWTAIGFSRSARAPRTGRYVCHAGWREQRRGRLQRWSVEVQPAEVELQVRRHPRVLSFELLTVHHLALNKLRWCFLVWTAGAR